MDSFVNLAKQGYAAYESSQSNVSKTGGQELNSSNNGRQGHQQFDEDEAVLRASEHTGGADSSLFSSAMSFVSSNPEEHGRAVDEEHVTNAHKQAYEQGDTSNMSAPSIGGAAALHVLQQFTSGGGGGSKTELISMAMAEATKLFDKSGGAASGNKQDAVNGAAMTVMKLLVQSKMSGITGGSDSGGLGSLMGLASKFM